jgi:hypothetical protein
VTTYADGALAYTPEADDRANPAATVDELATLLTPGRLSNNTGAVLSQTYKESSLSDDETYSRVLKLFDMAPEFHASNLLSTSAKYREPPAKIISQNRPYKAVVIVILDGGVDSYNMLVPHTCPNHDLYADYAVIWEGRWLYRGAVN